MHIKRATSGRYKVELYIGELSLCSGVSGKRLGQSYNFFDPMITGYVSLPKNPEFWPNLVIQHVDVFGKNKHEVIGSATMSKLQDLLHMKRTLSKTNPDSNKTVHEITENTDLKQLNDSHVLKKFTDKIIDIVKHEKIIEDEGNDSHFSWWTKFYASMTFKENSWNQLNKHSLVIYNDELENQSDFEKFQDWANTIPILKGFKMNRKELLKPESYCVLKTKMFFEKADGEGKEPNSILSRHELESKESM